MNKPFKVWNADRTMRKAIVANSLEQLTQFGKSRLEIPSTAPVKIVLECDGTEVDDEEYFAFLEANTVFQFLPPTENWKPPQTTGLPGGMVYDEVDGAGDRESIPPRLQNLLQKMQTDLTSVILLSGDDLETITRMSSQTLATHLAESEFFAEQIQVACRNRLEDIYQTQDAMELLRMYHASQQNSLLVTGNSKKRKSDD